VSKDIEAFDEQSLVRRWGKFWSVLPFVGDGGYRTYVAWAVAHEMFTPDDIENPDPPLDDQPYVGVAYLDSVIYAKGERWAHAWQLRLGVVGPASHADGIQRWVRRATGNMKPQGWSTQMPNELVVNVGYTGSYLLAGGELGGSAAWRLIPVANVGLGNYFTGAGLGLYGEIGWNLVDALGGTALRQGFSSASTVGVGPVTGWSVSLSGGVAGYGIVRFAARRHPLRGQSVRRHGALHRHGHFGHLGATQELRLLRRPDLLHQVLRNRASSHRVRDDEPVVALLILSLSSASQ
jgi:lipid A 3-O-deacylase